jgi:two-component system, OmpR family, sensor histidine kinase MprB
VSLRRRIAVAAAVAVAAVALAVVAISYASTRSHLISEVKDELAHQARGALEPHHGGGGPPGGGGPGGPPFHPSGPPERGAAAGIFQVVEPNGTIAFDGGLPVTRQVLDLANRPGASLFFDAHIGAQRIHYEIYAAWDRFDQHIVMVALPLVEADSVLHGLLVPYLALMGGGILFALLLGTAVSRSALAPIGRFLSRTEDVSSSLEHPQRLEETGPAELRRLAASFNQTLDALERSIGAQRNLVADASHELRTPIAALRSNIQIFLESGRLPAEDREGLQESILAELDELTQLVDNVVELARDPTPSPQRERVELDVLVREAVERTRRRAPSMAFNLKLEPTVVEGAPDRIGRAVTNVIDNARKWSPPDGPIDVRLREGVLSVRDHGPGFNEADLPHVFDRFYRAADARRLPGSGLGLAIVDQTARAYGGAASAGNAPGGGAVVQVSFGAAVREPEAPAGAPIQVR